MVNYVANNTFNFLEMHRHTHRKRILRENGWTEGHIQLLGMIRIQCGVIK